MPPSEPQPGAFENTLELAQAGDQEAMNRLFKQFYPMVRALVHRSLVSDVRYGRSWLDSRFSTGDVVQEVFRSVLKDVKSFQGRTEEAFSGYLAMVVRNRIIDAIRFHEADQRDGRITGPAPFVDERASEGQSPSEEVIEAEERERFHEAMKRLSEREQLLVRARLEGVASFASLKDQLGYPSVTSTRRTYLEAMARLAIWIRPEESDQDVNPGEDGPFGADQEQPSS